jgi:hypothetical protein
LQVRCETIQRGQQALYETYRDLGCPASPAEPMITIQPFGHRFLPAMYGCDISYAPNREPWAHPRPWNTTDIRNLPDWTPDTFQNAPPVQEITRLAHKSRNQFGYSRSMQNLGSVINTAMSVWGDPLFLAYRNSPDIVRRFYHNILQLTKLTFEYFSALDQNPPTRWTIGNCCVAMISPHDYRNCNYEFDRKIMQYCQTHGYQFGIHQDSDVNTHVPIYSRLQYTSHFSIGMDTDFEFLARYFPDASVLCIIFPQWLRDATEKQIILEITRLISSARKFREFHYHLTDTDSLMAHKIPTLYHLLQKAIEKITI